MFFQGVSPSRPVRSWTRYRGLTDRFLRTGRRRFGFTPPSRWRLSLAGHARAVCRRIDHTWPDRE
ncbi:hypothetical protein L665_00348 [Ralstonia solanacearum SD54]|nr:hypothetical protein F504_3724 [Ralstonia pseudosolanacearum FQY_4]ARU25708.1 hypothetical protein RSSE_p1527 [Ralstonia solanacearum]ESS51082.1 hypothetical protein L665_00348 [Ralstonia solanacearum SD54]